MVMEQKKENLAYVTIDSTKPKNGIQALGNNPYYIVAPSYTRTSAGVKALHLLCHSLNIAGKEAYLIITCKYPWKKYELNSELNTPILKQKHIRRHIKQALTPIVVYPEIFSGAPFGGDCIVRYVLNYPGLLGGDKIYDDRELCFSYSKKLANATNFKDNVLFIPASDMRDFHLPAVEKKRSGSCFYANKYHGALFSITQNSVRITPGISSSQSPKDIAKLFQESEVFYTYENSALALEAVLCGCPAVFLPTDQVTEIIAAEELGMDGYAFGTDTEALAQANATISKGIQNYINSHHAFWNQLEKFVVLTQAHSKQCDFSNNFIIPSSWRTFFTLIKERVKKKYF